MSLVKHQHMLGLPECCAREALPKPCVNRRARNGGHPYCACLLCSYAHSLAPWDGTSSRIKILRISRWWHLWFNQARDPSEQAPCLTTQTLTHRADLTWVDAPVLRMGAHSGWWTCFCPFGTACVFLDAQNISAEHWMCMMSKSTHLYWCLCSKIVSWEEYLKNQAKGTVPEDSIRNESRRRV